MRKHLLIITLALVTTITGCSKTTTESVETTESINKEMVSMSLTVEGVRFDTLTPLTEEQWELLQGYYVSEEQYATDRGRSIYSTAANKKAVAGLTDEEKGNAEIVDKYAKSVVIGGQKDDSGYLSCTLVNRSDNGAVKAKDATVCRISTILLGTTKDIVDLSPIGYNKEEVLARLGKPSLETEADSENYIYRTTWHYFITNTSSIIVRFDENNDVIMLTLQDTFEGVN